jgi:EmrB/QacA subfamily drug resistance transporter
VHDTLTPAPKERITHRRRVLIIAAALLALFLGALDALVMSAAMPTVVSDLGGLGLFSWVYSSYLLSRAVSLPLFGKLADILPTRSLYQVAIGLFVAGSLAAGFAESMEVLIICRAVQGVGAGGSFALVYVVLTDISSPETRAKALSLGSFIWGLASVLGPSLGAFIVNDFSWRWIFFINVPLGLLSMAGVAAFLVETREKKAGAEIDYAGAASLTICVVSLLLLFLVGGELHDWTSTHLAALALVSLISGYWFCRMEDRAADPILPLPFFTVRGFSTGNAAVFLSSLTIFALFAYAPLFVQAALGKPPMQVGTTVLALSLGWSLGSLVLGQIVDRVGTRAASILGAVFLTAGCGLTLTFSIATSVGACFAVFLLIGTGMGFVALGTILVVQNSLSDLDLGVATASNQFARTLGGTIGVGIAGGLFSSRFDTELHALLDATPAAAWPPGIAAQLQQTPDALFRPETQRLLPPQLLEGLHAAVASGVLSVFAMVLAAAVLCLVVCFLLPKTPQR